MLYANGDHVELARFNWHLIALATPENDPENTLVYTEGALPPLADALEWGLGVFDHLDLERPTTSLEQGFPPESKDWPTWLAHLRTNQDDRYSPDIEEMVEGWLQGG